MPIEKIETEIEIPEGYKFVRIGRFFPGDIFVGHKGNPVEAKHPAYHNDWIIIEKVDNNSELRDQNTKHKHADIIHAWAEGAIIQVNFGNTSLAQWCDCPDNNPAWSLDKSYRVKPAKKVIKFRNWLMKSGDIVVWRLGEGASCPDTTPNFVGWIGDWQQIEVEEQ